MPRIFDRLNQKKAKELRTLSGFVAIFCRENHATQVKKAFSAKDERLLNALGDKEIILCHDCERLLNHGISKLMLCPHDPKPMCKKCQTQCYAPGYRERIREVMRFSGLYLLKHGRVDLVAHYLF